MKLKEIVAALALEVRAAGDLDAEVRGCYVSDLLSDVLANCKDGNLWVTKQTHSNIVPVAVIKGLPGIVITGGRALDKATIEKAQAENVTLLNTPLSTFRVAGALFEILKNGTDE